MTYGQVSVFLNHVWMVISERRYDLESPLVLLCVLGVDLLHSLHVVLEVTDSMLPCLQPLSEQAGSLRVSPSQHSDGNVQQAMAAHDGAGSSGTGRELVLRTLEGSISGMASSLRMLTLVAALEGSWDVVGEVAEAMIEGTWP